MNLKKMEWFSLSLGLLLVSNLCWAGWTSSGGETLKDKVNPWFLNNTKVVKYCILVDEKNFGQSLAETRKTVESAIRIWKHQLGNLEKPRWDEISTPNSKEILKLGTQEFIEENCVNEADSIHNSGVDLFFQFGILTGEQFRYLGDPTKFIGVTVRTDYDPVNLKGRGFIYFSPESGPLRMNKKGLMENPWSQRQNGNALLFAVLHELGHVFGIQHTDNMFLMTENFLENFLRKKIQLAQNAEKNKEDLDDEEYFMGVNFFKFDISESFKFPVYMQCFSSSSSSSNLKGGGATIGELDKSISIIDQYFGKKDLTLNSRCFQIKKKVGQYYLEVVDSRPFAPNVSVKLVGRTDALQRFDSDSEKINLIHLWLTREQRVFRDLQQTELEHSVSIAGMQGRTLLKGKYKASATGVTRPFFVELGTSLPFVMGGVLDGVYYHNLAEGF